LIDWCLASTLAGFQLYRGVKLFLNINFDNNNTFRNKA